MMLRNLFDFTNKDVYALEDDLNEFLSTYGLQVYSFKIGWYNEQIRKPHQIDYHEDTLSFCIISLPEMFEKGFLPFISANHHINSCTQDPLDQFLSHVFILLKQKFSNYHVKAIHDFDMLPNRRPKVLVQTAGHVSGAAHYYQKSDIKHPPWKESKRMYGVCIHPRYGGWFALRGVAIYENVQAPFLEKKIPAEVLITDELKIRLLEKFNYEWQNGEYRDVIPVVQKYSDVQKKYFATKPQDRWSLLQSYNDNNIT